MYYIERRLLYCEVNEINVYDSCFIWNTAILEMLDKTIL